jgi:hypothetical protein
MSNLKTVLFFMMSILFSFSVQSQTVQQRTNELLTQNRGKVFDSGLVDMAVKRQGIPANIDNQIRKFIIQKFGGLEINQYGDTVERHLNPVFAHQKNESGKKYNNNDYYTYSFSSYVFTKGSNGNLKNNSNYEFVLEVIMKQNGEINEYKWTEKRTR